jgi:hypothetical protein
LFISTKEINNRQRRCLVNPTCSGLQDAQLGALQPSSLFLMNNTPAHGQDSGTSRQNNMVVPRLGSTDYNGTFFPWIGLLLGFWFKFNDLNHLLSSRFSPSPFALTFISSDFLFLTSVVSFPDSPPETQLFLPQATSQPSSTQLSRL